MSLLQVTPQEVYVVFALRKYDIPSDVISCIIHWTSLIEESLQRDILYGSEIFLQAERYDGTFFFILSALILLMALDMMQKLLALKALFNYIPTRKDWDHHWSLAIKNKIGQNKFASRTIAGLIDKEKEKLEKLKIEQQDYSVIRQQHLIQLTLDYKKKIDLELRQLCSESIQLVDGFLKSSLNDRSFEALLLCRKADYHRYIAEINLTNQEDKEIDKNISLACYEKAYDIITIELETLLKGSQSLSSTINQNDGDNTNDRDFDIKLIESEKSDTTKSECSLILLKLMITLNYVVFIADILHDFKKAADLGYSLFNEVLNYLTNNPSVDEDCYKDITCCMPLLRDNVTLWQIDGNASDLL